MCGRNSRTLNTISLRLFRIGRKRIGKGGWRGPPALIRARTHGELDLPTLLDIKMRQPVLIIRLTIQGYPLYIKIGRAVGRRLDDKFLPVLQSQTNLFEEGRTQYILVRRRTNGIETQSRKYVPGRGLPIVLITTITIGGRLVQAAHGLTHPILGLPGLTGIVVQVDHVLYRLVAM